MSDWIGPIVLVGAVGGVFALLYFVLRKAQAGDPSKRGQDSSPPGGYYTDVGG